MALAAAEITALKTEINTDPNGLGYASQENGQIVNTLNLVRGGATYEVAKGDMRKAGVVGDSVLGQEILEAIDPSDLIGPQALSDQKQRYLFAIASRENVRLTTTLKMTLRDMFGVGTTSRGNLIAITKRQGSRAEVLFGKNVDIGDVRKAKAL